MPQLTQYPYLGTLSPFESVSALITLCREVPADGETFKEFRKRLKALKLWDTKRAADTLRFFRMAVGDRIVPSPLMRAIAAESNNDAARDALAERLWECNPVLLKLVVERLAERVYPMVEMYTFLDSSAYPGQIVPRTQLDSWMWMCRGLDVLKILGVALALDMRGQQLLDRAKELSIEDYIEDDDPEPEPEPILDPAAARANAEEEEADMPAPAPGTPSPALSPAAPTTSKYASPLGRNPAVAVAEFAGHGLFPDQVTEQTTSHLQSWWSEQKEHEQGPSLDDFGLDGERWMEGAEEALYRLAVAAALVFRLGGGKAHIKAVFAALDAEGVLEALYYGNAPEKLSAEINPQALMLASLVARRCAEAPELEATLEKQDSAAAAFSVLEEVLGRGLFKLELFWVMRGLQEIGALRFPDLADYTALPHRIARDTLFRLGYLETPYAHDFEGLTRAAAAARRAAGDAGPADEVLTAFAQAAGCAYDCPHHKRCDFACRERAEA